MMGRLFPLSPRANQAFGYGGSRPLTEFFFLKENHVLGIGRKQNSLETAFSVTLQFGMDSFSAVRVCWINAFKWYVEKKALPNLVGLQKPS